MNNKSKINQNLKVIISCPKKDINENISLSAQEGQGQTASKAKKNQTQSPKNKQIELLKYAYEPFEANLTLRDIEEIHKNHSSYDDKPKSKDMDVKEDNDSKTNPEPKELAKVHTKDRGSARRSYNFKSKTQPSTTPLNSPKKKKDPLEVVTAEFKILNINNN